MMKRVLIYGVLFWVLGCYKAASQEAIGLYDLHYTLETDLSTPKGRNVAWDDVHVVSALQGIVNRDAPQLYVFFVDRDQLDIDKYWLNKYRRKGQWLYQKETVTYNTIEDLVSAYAGYIKGVVLYDERVPSTSNVASAIAGAEDLLPIRYDLDSESLYSRLVLGGPRLKVKRRLINEDGSVMFTGSGVIPGTNRNSTGSIKNDPYIWYIENYMKTQQRPRRGARDLRHGFQGQGPAHPHQRRADDRHGYRLPRRLRQKASGIKGSRCKASASFLRYSAASGRGLSHGRWSLCTSPMSWPEMSTVSSE